MQTCWKFQNFVVFVPAEVLNPKSLAYNFYALPTEPDGTDKKL